MPAEVAFGDMETSKEIYMLLEAVEWKWTISEILEQPYDLLMDVLQYKGLRAKLGKK